MKNGSPIICCGRTIRQNVRSRFAAGCAFTLLRRPPSAATLRRRIKFYPSSDCRSTSGAMNDPEFLAAFESCTLPFDEWRHRAHVRVAFLYLSQFDLTEATDPMRSGIQAHNAAHGVEESLHSGYHETTTQAFMQLIHLAIQRRGPLRDSQHFCEQHPELLDRRVLLEYYTRERIMSPEAKRFFVAPDLAPLDRIGRSG